MAGAPSGAGVQGLDRAIAKLKAVIPRVTRAAADQVAVEAKDLAKAIADAAPVKSGALKGSVRARQVSATAWEVVAGGTVTTKKVRAGVKDKDYAVARIVRNNKGEFDYARGVEFGHRTPDGKHVAAHPFFFTTYRARKAAIRRRILQRARQALANDNAPSAANDNPT